MDGLSNKDIKEKLKRRVQNNRTRSVKWLKNHKHRWTLNNLDRYIAQLYPRTPGVKPMQDDEKVPLNDSEEKEVRETIVELYNDLIGNNYKLLTNKYSTVDDPRLVDLMPSTS